MANAAQNQWSCHADFSGAVLATRSECCRVWERRFRRSLIPNAGRVAIATSFTTTTATRAPSSHAATRRHAIDPSNANRHFNPMG